jgi:hypothetical protein
MKSYQTLERMIGLKETLIVLFWLMSQTISAQLYTGISGLLRNPSADMNNEGDIVLGGYYMDKHFTPGDANDQFGFIYDGEKINTMDFYLAATPFKWVEVGYTITLQKTLAEGFTKPKYNQKDRYFSVKLNPLREGKYYPAIAIGANDALGSSTRRHTHGGTGAGYFCNYYVVATKHFRPYGHDFSVNVGYRYCPNEYSARWEGVIGGITWRPSWIPILRTVVEYTGNEINVGVDCLLWKHVFVQAVLQDGKYISGGLCLQTNLF